MFINNKYSGEMKIPYTYSIEFVVGPPHLTSGHLQSVPPAQVSSSATRGQSERRAKDDFSHHQTIALLVL